MPGTITVYQGAPPAGATAAQLAAARGDHDFLLAGAQTTEELNRRLSFAEIRPSPDGSGAIIPRADLMWLAVPYFRGARVDDDKEIDRVPAFQIGAPPMQRFYDKLLATVLDDDHVYDRPAVRRRLDELFHALTGDDSAALVPDDSESEDGNGGDWIGLDVDDIPGDLYGGLLDEFGHRHFLGAAGADGLSRFGYGAAAFYYAAPDICSLRRVGERRSPCARPARVPRGPHA